MISKIAVMLVIYNVFTKRNFAASSGRGAIDKYVMDIQILEMIFAL